MKYKALLFGSIGTLIESSNIQRNSFNEAFKEAGLDWYWDEQDYRILLKKSGGTKSCLLYTSPSPRDQRGSRLAGCA